MGCGVAIASEHYLYITTNCPISWMYLSAVPSTWAEAPIHNRRLRRCGSDLEHVSYHRLSPSDNRGERARALLTVSVTCDPSASHRSPRRLLASSAAG